jgi:hypothetical protein
VDFELAQELVDYLAELDDLDAVLDTASHLRRTDKGTASPLCASSG